MPRSNQKSSRREQILQCLAQMLEGASSTRITTAALAEQVGVSEAALYRHFPSKARMFEGLLEFTEETLFSRINGIQKEASSAQSRCYLILDLLLTFCERNPGIARLLTGEALTGETGRLYARVSKIFERMETHLRGVLREGEIRESLTPTVTSSVSAELLMATAEGKIRQFVRSGFNRSPTRDWSEQYQVIVSGFLR